MKNDEKRWLKYELHTHSYASHPYDKKKVIQMTAKDFVDTLKKKKVDVFSITDHNIYDKSFYDEIKKYIKRKKIKVIDGVELNVYVDLKNGKTSHFDMNAYFYNPDANKLQSIIKNLYKNGGRPSLSQIITELSSIGCKYLLIPEADKAGGILKIINKIDISLYRDINKLAMYKIFSAHDTTINFDSDSQNKWAEGFFESTKEFKEYVKGVSKSKNESIIKNIKLILDYENATVNGFEISKETKDKVNKILKADHKIQNIVNLIKKYSRYFAYFSFSDWHNKEPYNPDKNNFIYGSIDTYYDSFEMATLDPESRLIVSEESKINIPMHILKTIEFTMKKENINVNFTPGLNVIVGKRGSGKSLLMSILEKLQDNNATNINSYKDFDINNIIAKTYDNITVKPGSLASISVLRQNEIKDIFENPSKSPTQITQQFKPVDKYDNSKLLRVLEIVKKLKQYDKNYKNATTFLKQIKTTTTFTYEKRDFVIEYDQAKTMATLINRNIDDFSSYLENGGLNLSELKESNEKLKKQINNYLILIKLYNGLFLKKNELLDDENKKANINNKIILDARKEITSILNNIKNNFDIKLNYLKFKYLMEKTDFHIPSLSKKKIDKYLLVTSYQLSSQIEEEILNKITENINRKGKKYSSEYDFIEQYIEGERKLKEGEFNLYNKLESFVNKESLNPVQEFYKILTDFDFNEMNTYADIEKLIKCNKLKNLKEESPGNKSIAYLDMLFSLNESILLLDQPEDHIDNDYISNYLVPIIKKEKKGRQLIFVTHNPSVAVYADAFNYIYVVNDEGNIVYKNYMIERQSDKERIMNILDGGKFSFSNRNKKYGDVLGGYEHEI